MLLCCAQLRGKTIGFVGFGHIATTTAPLARALGMRVLALRSSASPHALADETLSMSGADGAKVCVLLCEWTLADPIRAWCVCW